MFLMLAFSSLAVIFHGMCVNAEQQHLQVLGLNIHVEFNNGTGEARCWIEGEEKSCESLRLLLNEVNYILDSSATIPSSKSDSGINSSDWDWLSNCPTWMHRVNGSHDCACGVSNYEAVKCDSNKKQTYVLDCYQMSFDNEIQEEILALSFYGCEYNHQHKNEVYRPVPANKSQINDVMCGQFNRTGRLCGECIEGHSPLIYSYELYCVPCSISESRYNWAKFLAMAFIPLTIFSIFVLILQFNANSPSLHVFILIAQSLSSTALIRIIMSDPNRELRIKLGSQLISTAYGIWNLDFFRALYPNVCIMNLSTLQVLMLDYVTAFFPLILILFIYTCVKFYSKDCIILVWLWYPCKRCFQHFKLDRKRKTSMIDVFATFLILSYHKILCVSFDLLCFTSAVNSKGQTVGKYVFYDSSYKYFGKRHLPYALIALTVFVCFNVIPFLLLLLYPFKWFHRILNYTNLNGISLQIFVDSFAGCFKDGMEPGTRDCRYFAAILLLMRIITIIIYQLTLSAYFFVGFLLLILTFAMALIVAQPYKTKYASYNIISPLMLTIASFSPFAAISTEIAEIKLNQALGFSIVLTIITTTLPLIAASILWLYKINLFGKLKSICIGRAVLTNIESDQESSQLIEHDNRPLLQFQATATVSSY